MLCFCLVFVEVKFPPFSISPRAVFSPERKPKSSEKVHCSYNFLNPLISITTIRSLSRIKPNQVFTISAMMAHNLSREIQMLARSSSPRAKVKRPAAWKFEKLDTIRHRIIQRAGRLNRPQGKLTLTMSANQAVRDDLMHFLNMMQSKARQTLASQ